MNPRVAVALGRLGSRVHGKLDARCPFDDEGAFATGTVSGFWGIVWGLAEIGFEVDAFADVRNDVLGTGHLAGANVFEIDRWPKRGGQYDTYVSVLESDLLSELPRDKPRICVQWLNDFSYANADPLDVVDLFVSPSRTHAQHLMRKVMIPAGRVEVVPISTNPEFVVEAERRPLSIAYASSPDRGLHHLVEMLPEVRKRVPGAELRVYYRTLPWLDDILLEKAQHGSKHWKRATIIKKAFDELGTDGENGLHLVGQLTTKKMVAELCRTEVLAYPCDPVRFTEGFSVTVLDACLAGCMPIVSSVDAFHELWRGATTMLDGSPSLPGAKEEWIRTIASVLTADEKTKEGLRGRARRRASELHRQVVAKQWRKVIKDAIARKKT